MILKIKKFKVDGMVGTGRLELPTATVKHGPVLVTPINISIWGVSSSLYFWRKNRKQSLLSAF